MRSCSSYCPSLIGISIFNETKSAARGGHSTSRAVDGLVPRLSCYSELTFSSRNSRAPFNCVEEVVNLSLIAGSLPPDLAEKAQRELGETDAVRNAAILDLRSRIELLLPAEQPHRKDDEYLLAFLRPQKFRVDVALQKVKAYTEFKNEHRELLRDMKAEDFRELLTMDFMRPLLCNDKEGRMVMCLFPAKMKAVKNPDLLLMWTIFSLEQTGVMFDPYMQVNGVIIVEDLEGFSFLQAMKMMSGPMTKVQDANFKFMREACPYRMRGMLLINEPFYMDLIMAIVRPFMSKKPLDRMQLLGRGEEGLKALHERVGKENMPPEFGGTLQETPGLWLEDALKKEKEGRMVNVL